jgi:sialate O-acetylesterase
MDTTPRDWRNTSPRHIFDGNGTTDSTPMTGFFRPAVPRIPIAFATFAATAFAAAPVPAYPFGDTMVLQRGMKVPVWGAAEPGAKVVVTFAGQTKETRTDTKGAWRVELDPMKASEENRVMTLACGADNVELKDVLVGEVWICSGQSNMEWQPPKTPLAKEAATANDSALRFRRVDKTPAKSPQTAAPGTPWLRAEGKPLQEFSAVAYAFGVKLRAELKVPVGLVGTYFGGTRIEAWTPPCAKPEVPSVFREEERQQSAVLYNGMIYPWLGYAIRGALWYQGETNCHQNDGMKYADRMQAMVSAWRAAWGLGDFPFLFVQIAPYNYGGDKLPVFWAAQTKAAKDIKNAAMAVTQDVGNWNNIHPADKKPVGERLARLALSRTYDKKFIDDTGPVFASAKAGDGEVKVTFKNAKSGLNTRDGKPVAGFELAGADGKFVVAEARIADGAVIVSAVSVGNPTQVRFGWKAGADSNLLNGEKMPAVTFAAPVEQ